VVVVTVAAALQAINPLLQKSGSANMRRPYRISHMGP